jgi:hypothetical protein
LPPIQQAATSVSDNPNPQSSASAFAYNREAIPADFVTTQVDRLKGFRLKGFRPKVED